MHLAESYKIKTLAESPEYYDQVIQLIEKNFGYILPHHYDVDFYPLMNISNHHQCYLLLKDKELVGHIGVKEHYLSYGEWKFKTSFFGGIAIDENFQGQGLFSSFFENILEKFNDSALYILWSDKHELYKKFDFSLMGHQYFYRGNDQVHPQEKSISDITDWEFKVMKKIYKEVLGEDTLHVQRSDEEWNEIKEISSIKILFLYENKIIKGYALKNKGMDLGGIVHEYLHPHPEKHLTEILEWGHLWHYQAISGNDLFEKQNLGLMKPQVSTLPFILNQFDCFIGGAQSI